MLELLLGVHDMQQASRKAEPGDYKHAVNDIMEYGSTPYVGMARFLNGSHIKSA